MYSIPGYRLTETLFESDASVVHRAVHEADGRPVILKKLKNEQPSPEEAIRYKREFDITRRLEHIPGVIRVYGVHRLRDTLFMAFKDIGGASADRLMLEQPFTFDEFFPIACRLAEILGDVHAAGVIHKDVNPSNIVINRKTLDLRLIDFGMAVTLPFEKPALKPARLLEGALPYMAPEQTGKMNRITDHRADFYALGATFYQMLANRLPFSAGAPAELVHCHIAHTPEAPADIVPLVPRALSDIVMKLLDKDPDRRYQTAAQLLKDLRACADQSGSRAVSDVAAPQPGDVPETLRIPAKIFGRAAEMKTLSGACEQAGQGNEEVVLVVGPAGIGKTELIMSFGRRVALESGVFSFAKFETGPRHPYMTLIALFRNLIRQALTEAESDAADLAARLKQRLGADAHAAVEIFPELAAVLGPLRKQAIDASSAPRNRFLNVLRALVLTAEECASFLVLFLDDLHRADASSLDLVCQLILSDAGRRVLFIGASRDSARPGDGAPADAFDILEKQGRTPVVIRLAGLNLNHVNQMVSETLAMHPEQTFSLSRVILEKTDGRPYFVKEFLNALHVKRLLFFDARGAAWKWDMDKIRNQKVTDNVAALITPKITDLPAPVQETLRTAACIGSVFDAATLSAVAKTAVSDILSHLGEAARRGFVVGAENRNRPFPDGFTLDDILGADAGDMTAGRFSFSHDEIHKAFYGAIPEPERATRHKRIGRLMADAPGAWDDPNMAFDVVHQLNKSVPLIRTETERRELAEWNLKAAMKSKTSAAYKTGLEYIDAGLSLLGKAGWNAPDGLMRRLYTEGAEIACLAGRYGDAARYAETVIARPGPVLDKSKAYEARILSLLAQNRLKESVDLALDVAARLGQSFPDDPSPADAAAELQHTLDLIGDRPVEDLADLPEMTDPAVRAAIHILVGVSAAIYHVRPLLLPLVIFKTVALSLRCGVTAASAQCYAAFGVILCGKTAHIDTGRRFGAAGLRVMARFPVADFRASVLYIFNYFIRPWKEFIGKCVAPLLEAHQTGVDAGDHVYASAAALGSVFFSFLAGKRLADLEPEIAAAASKIDDLKQDAFSHPARLLHQIVLNLMGATADPCRICGRACDEEKLLPDIFDIDDHTALFRFFFHKMTLCYLFDHHEKAEKASLTAERYLDGVVGTVMVPLFHFYRALIRLDACAGAEAAAQKEIMNDVDAVLEKLEIWASHAPDNYLHKLYLIKARKFAARGDAENAADCFTQSIENARWLGFLNEEALACEQAALFYVAAGRMDLAGKHMTDAQYAYLNWGAMAKVDHLSRKFSPLLPETSVDLYATTHFKGARKQPAGMDALPDALFLLKAVRAISGEIVLDRLLRTLMKIVIEAAGATKGYILLAQEDGFVAAVKGADGGARIDLLNHTPYNAYPEISEFVVKYTLQTRKSLLIDDGASSVFLKNAEGGVPRKSILCLPMFSHGDIFGLLYLENDLVSGAFTEERLKIFSLLAAQIAVSIENATLFQDLKKQQEQTAQMNLALQKEAAQRKAAEEKYKNIFRNAIEGIYQTTSDGRFLDANPAAARILGYDSREALIENVKDISRQLYVDPADRFAFLNRLKNEHTVAGYEVRFRKKNGEQIWVTLHSRLVYAENGAPAHIEGMIEDCTARKAMERELAEYRSRLERTLEEQAAELAESRRKIARMDGAQFDGTCYHNMVGASRRMRDIFSLITVLADRPSTVLITGETGVGKELVAEALHHASGRAGRPLIKVNCSALSETVLESELFGHVRGAFTGAVRDKTGRFEKAGDGTILLDEIGDVSLDFQKRLLRVLQEREFEKVGDTQPVCMTARVLAATNQDILESVRAGTFRKDLYYRLKVVELIVPPLRDRKEDIPVLVRHFLDQLNQTAEKEITGVSDAVLDAFTAYEWPGNVRELQHALESAGILCRDGVIRMIHLPEAIRRAGPEKAPAAGEPPEKAWILDALDAVKWNKTAAARLLGVSRRTLYRKMERYGVKG